MDCIITFVFRLSSVPKLFSPPVVDQPLYRCDVSGWIVAVTCRGVNGHDCVDRLEAPAVDVEVGDQLIPILHALLPRTVHPVALIIVVPLRPTDIAERMGETSYSSGAAAALMHEESQRIGRIDAVLYAEIVERLSLTPHGRTVLA